MAICNYVGGWLDWENDKVIIVERDIETNERFISKFNAPYYFYVEDSKGEYESIFGHKLKRLNFSHREEFENAKRRFKLKFESDFSPLDRVLMDVYYNKPTPQIHFAFFDIEVNYSQKIGFAGPQNPYAEINAITLYQSWKNKYTTFVVPPPNWINNLKEIEFLLKDFNIDIQPNIIICENEISLLIHFLDAIQDSDIISGWNSDFFDIPYIIKRIELTMGKSALKSLGFPGAPYPKEKIIERFGTKELTYKIYGRNHLDYLQLFKKFTFEGRTSYSLANIANEELDIPKLNYDGTLEQLYQNNFLHFICYNIRDVEILKLLDDKYKFISLVTRMAHENTVLFENILGTVKYVETGITNHAHNVLNKIVNDKHITENEKVEGAIVLNPRIGLHEWIGSVDINSLYPNTIRSLNISPEKIIGQFTHTLDEEDWEAIKNKNPNKNCCLILESGEQLLTTAKEWNDILKENKWAISAYGTVFDQSNGVGIIPEVLGFWYTERKRLQAEKKKWAKLYKDSTDENEKAKAKKQEEYFDLLQLTKKISLNSAYGALLSPAFRFSDMRMGASVTATGRKITTYMIEKMGELLTNEFHPLIKKRVNPNIAADTIDMEIDTLELIPNFPLGSAIYYCKSPAILYSDTDSVYYKTFASNKEEAVEIADLATYELNESFPQFMRNAFNCQKGFDNLIKAGREIVGIRGIFQAKKKYMIKVVDLEGFSVDKMKSMGSEIKKADTPKIIQQFLKNTVDMILDGKTYKEISIFINKERMRILKDKENIFSLGVAKQVNNLDKYYAEYLQYEKPGIEKVKLPGHVRAAINYNELLNIFDKGAKQIRSGDKIFLYYIKPNEYNLTSIAIPAEFVKFPDWFNKHFEVDIHKTEDKMFELKLAGIFKVLKKDVPTLQTELMNKLIEF